MTIKPLLASATHKTNGERPNGHFLRAKRHLLRAAAPAHGGPVAKSRSPIPGAGLSRKPPRPDPCAIAPHVRVIGKQDRAVPGRQLETVRQRCSAAARWHSCRRYAWTGSRSWSRRTGDRRDRPALAVIWSTKSIRGSPDEGVSTPWPRTIDGPRTCSRGCSCPPLRVRPSGPRRLVGQDDNACPEGFCRH
jgi:hypothetical protein